MKKIYSFISLLSLTVSFAQDGAPASPYYNGFNWTQTGSALKTALATKITSTHLNELSYSQVWNALKIVDLDPNNSSEVILIYGWENGSDADVTNDRSRNKDSNGGAVGDWNREHVFAQSLGNPDLGSSGPGADAQMLRSCDVQRNGERGNRKFAAGTGNSHTVGANWYPGDEWKGDCARIIMYMYLHYGSQCLPNYVFTGTPVPTDANMLDLMLQWNAEDPVSQYEDNRNTYLGNSANTFGQGNRNPFIDNPYLATVIWGGPVAQNRWPNIFLSNDTFEALSDVSIYPNPSTDQKINIETEAEVENIQLINVNGQLMMEVKNPTKVYNTYTIENLPDGFYFVKISTESSTVTKKVFIN
ncbi:MAG: endonuclease [Flavobacteriales bacterium]|nr:endonuclease [Flavobacteriales bacterium]